MPTAERKKIRVVFANCPRLDILACEYLILAQNLVQDVFEFEVYHHWLFVLEGLRAGKNKWLRIVQNFVEGPIPFRKSIAGRFHAHLDRSAVAAFRTPLRMATCVAEIRALLEPHDRWLGQLPRSYGGWNISSAPTIVITETPIRGGFFANAESDCAIISIANWQRNHAPPSVLEFLLNAVERYSIRLAFPSSIGSHYPVRGCVWDFNANVKDARAGVLLGHLCAFCFESLASVAGNETAEAIKKLLRHEWIGRIEDSGSIASNVKRVFAFNLARNKGLSRGVLDQVREIATSEVIKWTVVFLLGVLAARYLPIAPKPPNLKTNSTQTPTVPDDPLLHH